MVTLKVVDARRVDAGRLQVLLDVVKYLHVQVHADGVEGDQLGQPGFVVSCVCYRDHATQLPQAASKGE